MEIKIDVMLCTPMQTTNSTIEKSDPDCNDILMHKVMKITILTCK